MASRHEAVPAILNGLKMKFAAFTRCVHEYGTYVDELIQDKKRLEEMTTHGGRVEQQKQVISETEAMIPIVASNTKKMATKLGEYWHENEEALASGIQKADSKDAIKWTKELGTLQKHLSKLEEIPPSKSPLTATGGDDIINAVRSSLSAMLEESEASGGAARQEAPPATVEPSEDVVGEKVVVHEELSTSPQPPQELSSPQPAQGTTPQKPQDPTPQMTPAEIPGPSDKAGAVAVKD